MNLGTFWRRRVTMKRGAETNEEETETDTVDEDATESEESVATRKLQFLGLPIYKLSYKRMPKKFIKFAFLSLNGANFLAGITATIISIWMLADSKLMSRLLGQRLFVTTLLFIGMFSSGNSFLGILAFVKRKRNFLLVYIVCHSVSLCLIFVCAIMSFTFFEQITRKVRDDMVNTIVNYRSLDWVTEAWDNTHKYLSCCGIKSFRDWQEYRMGIPQSCCSTSIDKCLNMSEDVAYQSGCLRGAVYLLKSHIHAVALSALFISVAVVRPSAVKSRERLERAGLFGSTRSNERYGFRIRTDKEPLRGSPNSPTHGDYIKESDLQWKEHGKTDHKIEERKGSRNRHFGALIVLSDSLKVANLFFAFAVKKRFRMYRSSGA